MFSRRSLIQVGTTIGLGSLLGSRSAFAQALKIQNSTGALMKTKGIVDGKATLPLNVATSKDHYLPKHRFGLGGLAAGNGFNTISTDKEILGMLNASWDAGVRFYDTSPFYGLSLSERRFGDMLRNKNRDEYILASKVGRLLTPSDEPLPKKWHWANPSPFHYKYDYTAAGTRRSVEDTLHRIGVSSLDIVFIHDLSPSNSDLGDKWVDSFDEAMKGAIPELIKMKKEGKIKGWGFGINTPHALYKALENGVVPDICLLALQYSILDHEEAINKTFPLLEKHGISAVIGAPLNGGFLAGRDRFNYKSTIPPEMNRKYKELTAIANQAWYRYEDCCSSVCSCT